MSSESAVLASCHERDLRIPATPVVLSGDLAVPEGARGVVVFAHGSGSGRRSPRNRRVAAFLRDVGLATLLVDLLTAEEADADEVTGEHRFDIALLAGRVAAAARWLSGDGETAALPQGWFGASTGAAAALVAAAAHPELVRAVVSRGGRPDLAGRSLAHVVAPTLLVVGGADTVVIDLNRQAYVQMRCTKRLEIIPGATHLFPEPGTLESVADLAREWFLDYVVKTGSQSPSATGRSGGV